MLLTRQNDLLNRPLLDKIAQLKRQLSEFENSVRTWSPLSLVAISVAVRSETSQQLC
jgi:hypothetical protein